MKEASRRGRYGFHRTVVQRLVDFIGKDWNLKQAVKHSKSLEKLVNRLKTLEDLD